MIRMKFGGKCAYSGTDLEDDWQVDHIEPLIRCSWTKEPMFPDAHRIDNMVPCQRAINNYKSSLSLHLFRTWLLGGLHERLAKLPKNPTVPSTINHKKSLLRIAAYFGITPDKPFDGRFYFEQYNKKRQSDKFCAEVKSEHGKYCAWCRNTSKTGKIKDNCDNQHKHISP